MGRFRWSSPYNGRVINRYIDMICRDYPAIAKDVVRHRIGDLGSWFEDKDGWTCGVGSAKCGCLVGTTALVAMKRYKKAAKEIGPDEADGARVLYDLIVAKTGRDVSKYDDRDGCWGDSYTNDPLYELIQEAGSLAAEEAGWTNYDADYDLDYDREKEVTDRIEMRIRRNLNMPLPKKYRAAA